MCTRHQHRAQPLPLPKRGFKACGPAQPKATRRRNALPLSGSWGLELRSSGLAISEMKSQLTRPNFQFYLLTYLVLRQGLTPASHITMNFLCVCFHFQSAENVGKGRESNPGLWTSRAGAQSAGRTPPPVARVGLINHCQDSGVAGRWGDCTGGF